MKKALITAQYSTVASKGRYKFSLGDMSSSDCQREVFSKQKITIGPKGCHGNREHGVSKTN